VQLLHKGLKESKGANMLFQFVSLFFHVPKNRIFDIYFNLYHRTLLLILSKNEKNWDKMLKFSQSPLINIYAKIFLQGLVTAGKIILAEASLCRQ